MRTLLTVALAFALCSCTKEVPDDAALVLWSAETRADFCRLAKPIKWTTYDSRETVRQIIEHNRTGLNTCSLWSDPDGRLLYGVEP